MKFRNILIGAALLAGLASCSEAGRKTVISGTLPIDLQFIDTLEVYFEDSLLVAVPVDTVTFAYKAEIPVDITKLGILATYAFQIPFVSDGTEMTLKLKDEELPILIPVKEGQACLTDRMNKYSEALAKIQEEMMEIYQNSGLTEEEMMVNADSVLGTQFAKIKDLNVKTIKENPDNILSVYALMNSEMDGEFPELLKGLSPEIKKRPDIKALIDQMESAVATSIGGRFLDFEASLDSNDLEGSKTHLSEYVGKGKFILLDFWASWCGPCRAEVPYIKAAYENHVGENFDVVSVAVNDDPSDSAVAAVDLGIIWNSLIGAGAKPAELYGVTGIPHLILFGPDGTILARGFRGEEIEATIAKFLQ